jgi:tetratricopeptide (TPR) repeat protein
MASLDFIENLPLLNRLPFNPREKILVGSIFLLSFVTSLFFVSIVFLWRVTEPSTSNQLVLKDEPKKIDVIIEYDSLDQIGFLKAAEQLEQEGKLVDAAHYLEKVALLNPNNYILKERIANIAINIGKPERAKLLVNELRDHNPNSETIALLLLQITPTDSIISVLDNELADFSKNPNFLTFAGKKLYKTNRKLALEFLNEAYMKDQNNHVTNFLIGSHLLDCDSLQEAKNYLQRSVDIKPLNSNYQTKLAALYHKKSLFSEAESHYKSAIKVNSNNFTAVYNLAELYYNSLNSPLKAAAQFKRALEIRPTSWESGFNLGVIYLSKDKIAGAIKLLSDANINAPKNIRILHQLAVAYEKNGEPTLALEQYNKILSINQLDDIALYKIKFLNKK